MLAEKPSVARDIARVLGAGTKGDGYLHGNGYVVTWAIGHLAALAQPHEINPEWRQWRRDLLPMLPDAMAAGGLREDEGPVRDRARFSTRPKISRVVCATDAGREGELIFRYIYEAAQCAKPVSRLWISSLTPDAIRKGFDTLRPAADYDPLADAARGRSRADWLVGMNLSRAYSLAYGEDLSVGRVQTPTLAMLVERELAIRRFVPEDYLEVVATFRPSGDPKSTSYQGTWFRERTARRRTRRRQGIAATGHAAAARRRRGQAHRRARAHRPGRHRIHRSGDAAHAAAAALRSHRIAAARQPPLRLQRAEDAGYRAGPLRTPQADQLSAHRQPPSLAGCRAHAAARRRRPSPRPTASTLRRAPASGRWAAASSTIPRSPITTPSFPPPRSPDQASLSPDERKIYDLICRRLLSAWHDDHIWSVTTVITAIRNDAIVDRYHTSGSAVQQVGWKVLDLAPAKAKKAAPAQRADAPAEQALPPGLAKGQPQDVLNVEVLKKKTRAPKRFTEGTLLTAMETAGKTLDEKELSDAMKETGLGTPATRASIIEVLLKREYIVRNGKSLEATDKGIRLIEVVHPEVKSPAMTGQWEAYLQRIQRGTAQLVPFLKGIEDYVREVVGKVGQVVPAARPAAPQSRSRNTALREPSSRDREVGQALPPAKPAAPQVPVSPNAPLSELLQTAFGFPSFRPNQEAVCQAVIDGRDVLLVMPTGSGKSLCYQLPAIARGGTTLVISPLIALMEDQVAKLKERGFAVERIHSGRDRAASRQACIDYLNGTLQFLFIAPERLRVAGFPEMLAKRKPSLIAIDEAHCISQWGHDFRPDYRMLGQYLPTLRPAPVIALTATATPIVQNDIAAQLALEQPARFIHGFRRDNLAIEVVEVAPSQRADLTLRTARSTTSAAPRSCTRRRARRPPPWPPNLRRHFPCAAYHAGLDAEHRKRVQEEFLAGRIEVMVATIAFGMGIDKPDVRTVIHTALPGSLEAYYQEIGRAGRDGAPSRTILMHSYADRRTHDFFFERDYPDVNVLDGIFARLRAEPVEKAALQQQLRMDADIFDKALEKLWIHGGALVDFAENVSRGHDHWRESYIAQGEQKQQQLDLMLRYAESSECRMAALVRHFGDLADARKAVRHLRFLRARRLRRAALPPRHRSRTRRGALGGRPCFVRTAADPPANCTPTCSRTGR